LLGPSDTAAHGRPAAPAPLTPASPSNNNNNSRDKGKQRASPIVLGDDDDDSSFNGEETERLPSSGSTAAEALSRSQPYPTRSRGSVLDAEMREMDEDVNSDRDSDTDSVDVEFPPLADWSKIPRRYAAS